MKTSISGRARIQDREGRELVAYRDTKGILTIGVGHTGRMSLPVVTPGMRITEAQCDAMLAYDLAPVERVINTAVTVPVSQNEFDALASFGFNIGEGGLRGSTVVKRLNLGDVAGAADAFMNWCKPVELTQRRRDERVQFLKPDAAVAAERAAVLHTRATRTKSRAKTSQASAGTMVVAGAAMAGTSHSHALLIVAGLLVLTGAAIATVAVLARRKANTLSTNAKQQSAVAAIAQPTAS